ncbi:PREDICTED: uncharacterized protein LOC108575849 isoform X2 [Habropoda laboriosa]|uniref:uncharacterized protein LOC108575849 isoform X2 n=1 Tax=Habropoda laboriosa TaxID=597456 RepID=UPI00083E630B|nr:PREDICTED: uncharacterized protein LOC108575849 isoform X2 [Habropoda laboriosa]
MYQDIRANADATAEGVRKYKSCMMQATIRESIPFGMICGAIAYSMMPKHVKGTPKRAFSSIIATAGFISSRVSHIPRCYEHAFGTKQLDGRRDLHNTSDRVHTSKEEDQEDKYMMHPDKTEEEPAWNSYDPPFESNTNEFDYTSDMQDVLQEDEADELTNKQERNVKKRVTYDDLFKEHMSGNKDIRRNVWS